MADWILVPCLVQLRADFDALAPERDRASDGSIGDDAHADRVSDHNPDETGAVPIRDADRTNEVHAIDVDSDLRTPGLTMEMVVQRLLARCRSGAEARLRYIIYNRRIWEASNDWRQQAYSGANPHTEHAHFSASYESTREADTSPWHLEDSVMTTPAQILWAHDVDPSAGTYSAGGALWTVLGRTGLLNTLSAQIQGIVGALEDQETDLDALGASLAVIASGLNQLLADPADVGEAHPLVAAYRYVQANPAPSA